jgi:hypothetical protein
MIIYFLIGFIIGYVGLDLYCKFNEEKVIKWKEKWSSRNSKKNIKH